MFPATFDAAAEEVVCADAGHVQLSDLVRRSLVLFDETTKRYRLHDFARLFADAKLSAEERAVGQKRFATHYQNVLAAANKLYKEGGESLLRGLTVFDFEWGNIQAGHAWGNALANLGLAYGDLGETSRAIQFHEQSLLIYREIGDRRGEGADLGNLGNAYVDLGETSRAIQCYEQQLTIGREIGDRRGEENALGNQGIAYAVLGETRRAIQVYEQTLLIHRQIGDRRGEGNALFNLSLALDQLGERAQAIHHAEQALTIREQIEDPRAAKVRARLAAWREQTNT